MARRRPKSCRPHAYDLLAEQVPVIETPEGLLRAAVAVSMHALEGIDVCDVEARIDALADAIRSRVRSGEARALVAHAHAVLFEEEGFRGNTDDYYDPMNSYLPNVLETKRGLPITLSLVYKCVTERLGFKVVGIKAPSHFLVRIDVGADQLLVDPFFHGRVMSRDEAYERIEQMSGAPMPRAPELLASASHREWVSRIVRNLQRIFERNNDKDHLAAMTELQSLLAV